MNPRTNKWDAPVVPPASPDKRQARFPAARSRASLAGTGDGYNYGEAAKRYGAYLEEFPNMTRSSLARMRHAQSFIRSDQPDLALKVLDAYKQSNLAFQRELVRAEALALAGRVDEAGL